MSRESRDSRSRLLFGSLGFWLALLRRKPDSLPRGELTRNVVAVNMLVSLGL